MTITYRRYNNRDDIQKIISEESTKNNNRLRNTDYALYDQNNNKISDTDGTSGTLIFDDIVIPETPEETLKKNLKEKFRNDAGRATKKETDDLLKLLAEQLQ